MNDQVEATATAPEAPQSAPAVPFGIKTFDDVPQRRIFGGTSQELIEGAGYAGQVQAVAPDGLPVVEFKEDWPTGYGMLIQVLSQEVTVQENGEAVKRRNPTSIVIWPVPTRELLLTTDEGKSFLDEAVNKELAHRCVRPLRGVTAPLTVIGELPRSVHDFAVSTRGSGGIYKPFNDLSGPVLKSLKSNNDAFKVFTPQMLRECLEYASRAKSLYPQHEEHGLFVMVLDIFIQTAAANQIPTDLFEDWKATRDTKESEAIDFDGIDLSALSVVMPTAPAAA